MKLAAIIVPQSDMSFNISCKCICQSIKNWYYQARYQYYHPSEINNSRLIKNKSRVKKQIAFSLKYNSHLLKIRVSFYVASVALHEYFLELIPVSPVLIKNNLCKQLTWLSVSNQ